MRESAPHAGSSPLRSVPLRLVALAALGVVAAAPAEAGHELSFYPSFYPQEISVETIEPAAAVTRLSEGSLHAFVGGAPIGAAVVGKDVAAVESFGSFVVVTVDAGAVPERAERCAIADAVLARLAAVTSEYVFHPFPVTPLHADYLGEFDRAEASRMAVVDRGRSTPSRPGPRLRARGPRAERWLAALPASASTTGSDATIEAIDLDTLLGEHRMALNGWSGPPWLKAGWYHAYLLLGPAVSDADTRRRVDALYGRLVGGAHDSVAARIDLERRLVSALTSGCERVVVGYTLKREYTSSEYSQGVENVGSDSHSGLDAAIFVRTVKLKDFPWNGWLRVGVATPPAAAWNPVGGFTDPAGRLIWAALGDPALIPAPRSARWLPNRIDLEMAASPPHGIVVPADARRPAPGTGRLTAVGPGRRARTKLVYRVRAGAFHDGTPMTVADVVHALGFAYRWGVAGGRDHDVGVAAATRLLRERLVGLRVMKVETVVKKYSDVEFIYQVPVVEVYLDHAVVADDDQVATIAAPWSVLPWHVVTLLEEAVRRGVGAFSEAEARRRGVAWLDPVRNAGARAALAALVDEFEARAYVPPALGTEVTAAEARARWSALKRFGQIHGHLLVTNGPYRLDRWSSDGAVLGVFRDLGYPIGVGHFDEHAIAVRAYAAGVTPRGDRIEVRADVERVSKFARSYEIVREPLGPEAPGLHEHVPVCRYVVVSAGGAVVRAGQAPHDRQRLFRVDLRGLPPGAYSVMLGLEADGNAVDLPITVVQHRVGGAPRP